MPKHNMQSLASIIHSLSSPAAAAAKKTPDKSTKVVSYLSDSEERKQKFVFKKRFDFILHFLSLRATTAATAKKTSEERKQKIVLMTDPDTFMPDMRRLASICRTAAAAKKNSPEPDISFKSVVSYLSGYSYRASVLPRMNHYDLKPNSKTFSQLISLKDFDGAYGMLNDLKKLNLPATSMYNAIIGGYFREKKSVREVSKVLNEMKLSHAKPDSITYAYFINNCNSEEKATEYYEELKALGVQVTKEILMALINAFASCGQFEKAKQVLLYKEIPIKYLTEIRSVLVLTLASHGEIADALDIYDEIKEGGDNLAPRAAICLIERLQHKGALSRVLQLVEDLHDPVDFNDCCKRAIQYCIRNKHLRHTVDLLKRFKYRLWDDELAMDSLFDEVFFLIPDTEPVDLQFSLDLLQAIKYELGVTPPCKCLDFLLRACTDANDLQNSIRIWKEYHADDFPYTVTNYFRMYNFVLASQDFASFEIMETELELELENFDPNQTEL